MAGILDGVRVIDLSEGLAGSCAALFLAEAGADVVKVEPPGGTALRGSPPFAVWNRSKRSIALDAFGADRATFETLARAAQVLIHDFAPVQARARGLDDPAMKRLAPDLIVASITGFPTGHDWDETPARDTLVLAAGGLMDEQPAVNREGPSYLRFPLGSWGAAWLAAIGIAGQLFAMRQGAAPGAINTSLFQGALVPTMMLWRRTEVPSPHIGMGPASLFECSDGVWVHLMDPPDKLPSMQRAFAELGPEGVAAANATTNLVNKRFPNLGAYMQVMRTVPSAQWLAESWTHDVSAQPAVSMGSLYFDEQAQANGYVIGVDDPDFGRTRQPGLPFKVTPPASPKGPAPRLDADRAAILAEWTPKPAASSSAKSAGRPRRPLEGLKVVDFGNFLAGPLAPQMMADLGATVIKLESVAGDQMRWAEHAFLACQRGKRSIAADLRDPATRPIVERLVAWADVVHHNMRMPAATKLGLDYESLRRINPRLVYCHVSAYGPVGPRKDWPGYDQMFQASSGWELEGAGLGNRPVWHRFGMMDHQAAMASLYATLLGLIERERTGEGQAVAASLLGGSLFTSSETLVLPNGELAPYARLDHDQMGVSPGDRLYPCADGWIALVADERALSALADRLKATGPASLAPALTGLTVADALAAAQAAGADAAPVRRDQAAAFFDNPANRRLGLVAATPHPRHGMLELPGASWRFEGVTLDFPSAPPLLGQHSREILAELGFGGADVDDLIARNLVVQA